MQGTSNVADFEKKKYESAWAIPEYGKFSPAENILPLFKQMVRTKKGTLLDIGCGTGRAGKKLSELGWNVILMDFVRVDDFDLPFIEQNIFEEWKETQLAMFSAIYTDPMATVAFRDGQKYVQQGFCCDVMEHLPPDKIDTALSNIFGHCHNVFFSINFNRDHFGQMVGHPLHLTVKPFTWWLKKLGEFGFVRNARDLIGEGVFDVRG